jgi:formylglycine-generating enzyme required for sulfatase activity
MAVLEVRLPDYRAVVGNQTPLPFTTRVDDPEGPIQAKCSWLDCVAFCNRLSEREGRRPAYVVDGKQVQWVGTADGYRLPTEAEWEFACRAGTTEMWYFGLTAAEAFRDLPAARSRLGTHVFARDVPVAPANPFGLVDMYASSNEWCWDWFDLGYYRSCAEQGTVVDPLGPPQGTTRTLRGGSSYNGSGRELSGIHSPMRELGAPDSRHPAKGFGRVVLPVAPGSSFPPPGDPTQRPSGSGS